MGVKAKIILDFENKDYSIFIKGKKLKIGAFSLEINGQFEEFKFSRGGETKRERRKTLERIPEDELKEYF